MLSLSNGLKVAIINEDKTKGIYLKEIDDDEEAELDTTDANKKKIFLTHLKADKKLDSSEINEMMRAFDSQEEILSDKYKKLQRKYNMAKDYLESSLKKHLSFPKETKLMPIIDERSYRMFVSGLSGSGKSYFIANFLKFNKPTKKEAGIFLFSPISDDKAFKSIKNLIHLDLDEIREEMEGDELSIEHIPEGSVVIFDDIESYKKEEAQRYMELRDIFLERGRHLDISTICVSHNCMNGNKTKSSLRESQFFCLFPSANKRDVQNLLKTYGGLETGMINCLMNLKTRSLFFKKTIPQYAIGEHDVVVI